MTWCPRALLSGYIFSIFFAFIFLWLLGHEVDAKDGYHWFYDGVNHRSNVIQRWYGDGLLSDRHHQIKPAAKVHPRRTYHPNVYHRGFGRSFPIHNSKILRPRLLPNHLYNRIANTMRVPNHIARDKHYDSWVPAGYTFLGQFIDHDITFDVSSKLGEPTQTSSVKNARTADLDLDSVYGGGPEQSPFLYNLPYLRVGKRLIGHGLHARFDFLRTNKRRYRPGPQGGKARALIGDARNDENFVVAQLHFVFIAFHNRLVDIHVEKFHGRARHVYCRTRRRCGTRHLASYLPREVKQKIFETVKDHVIHYYHRIIVEDFLPRVIGKRMVRHILQHGRSFYFPGGFGVGRGVLQRPFIPIEFAVAAFRYGHSQVRETYQIRRGRRQHILTRQIRAFQPLKKKLVVDWSYFFPIRKRPPYGFNFARKIDRKVVPSLFQLARANAISDNRVVSLPARNLLRGDTLSVPSGQSVAHHIIPLLYEKGLLQNHRANFHGAVASSWRKYILPPDQHVRRILKRHETPLWYYILQEAEFLGGMQRNERHISQYPRRHPGRVYRNANFSEHSHWQNSARTGGHVLGPVGGAIVGEVLFGLLEYYGLKTGKGLKYQPAIKASLRPSYAAPLSATPATSYRSRPLYMMRNMIIDAGLAQYPRKY
ncbi:MAG: peroxidase family protein [Pseudomonadota bacterium]